LSQTNKPAEGSNSFAGSTPGAINPASRHKGRVTSRQKLGNAAATPHGVRALNVLDAPV
jgi:hypothetical protein